MATTSPDLNGETDPVFSLAEICERCGLHAELVTEMVEYGVITPVEPEQQRWRFTAAALVRLSRAQRLRHDLDINLPGLALSLELLDRIDTLDREVESLRQRLRQLHD